MIQKSTLLFLNSLTNNNNKIWFEENKSVYINAKNDFLLLTEKVIQIIKKIDNTILEDNPKNCIFRINRDVRFSNNKNPYKTNFGMHIKKGGKKSVFAGYYIHIEPNNKSFFAGGLWHPEPETMFKIRQELFYQTNHFLKIIHNKPFKKIFIDLNKNSDIQLKKMPKGFNEGGEIDEYIKLKSWIVTTPLKDTDLINENVLKMIQDNCKTIYPFIHFLNNGLE